jgi:hypothetical protein
VFYYFSFHWFSYLKGAKTSHILEISVKSGKDSTSTLSLVIHRVRLKKKKPAKKYISIQGGGEPQKTINFDDS